MGCFMDCKGCESIFGDEKKNEINISDSYRKIKKKDIKKYNGVDFKEYKPIFGDEKKNEIHVNDSHRKNKIKDIKKYNGVDFKGCEPIFGDEKKNEINESNSHRKNKIKDIKKYNDADSIECKRIFGNEKKNEINESDSHRKDKIKDIKKYSEVDLKGCECKIGDEKKKKINVNNSHRKNKFNYLKLNDELLEELQKLLKNSIKNPIKNKKIDLNTNNAFEREDVQKENKEIITKIKKQLINYKSSMENYLMKRAIFLKKVGYLVRFSNEIAKYIIQYLLKIFMEKNIIKSKEKETIRLYFSSWIKELFNEGCFKTISENKYIYAQIKNEIEKEINSKNEKEFLINIFPNIIKLYFHCFLTDIKVDIKYADEDSKFDSEYMIDILLTGLEEGKNILFTFLPGLYCNGRYFENSYIYVTTYPIDNPNKFPFKKPIFKAKDSNINIELDNINLKNRRKNGLHQERKKNQKIIMKKN